MSAGRVHFIRRVQPDGTIAVLNVNWPVPHADPLRGVWATRELTPAGATLAIYDATPDVAERICLVTHPFPLREPVQPRQAPTAAFNAVPAPPATVTQLATLPLLSVLPQVSAGVQS